MPPVALLLLISLAFLHESSAQRKCGIASSSGASSKIVGGTAVNSDDYPWFVSLVPSSQMARAQPGSGSPLTVFCGASLITAKHAVSAAHCFAAFRSQGGNWKKKLTAVMGLRNRCTPSWKDASPLSNVIIHSQYNSNTVKNDISLMYLAKDMSAFVPICFPPAGVSQRTGPVDIIGYGTTKENGKSPCNMLEATVEQYSRKQCLNTAVGYQIRNLPGVICAGLRNGSSDSCQGDSGGPLMVRNNGQYTLEGIVSFGNGCARANNPGVYTSVSYYRNWVTSKLSNNRGSTPNKPDYGRWVKCIMNFNVRPCLNFSVSDSSNSVNPMVEETEYNVFTPDPGNYPK